MGILTTNKGHHRLHVPDGLRRVGNMTKTCKQCGKEIKGKPTIYDDYYFCNSAKEKSDKTCLGKFLNLYMPEQTNLAKRWLGKE